MPFGGLQIGPNKDPQRGFTYERSVPAAGGGGWGVGGLAGNRPVLELWISEQREENPRERRPVSEVATPSSSPEADGRSIARASESKVPPLQQNAAVCEPPAPPAPPAPH